MDARIRHLLAEYKDGLKQAYGQRLRGVYLFGSYARGEQDNESDVDVLLVLDTVPHYGAEIEHTGRLTSELSLRYNLSISRIFMAEDDWLAAEQQLSRNVRAEAIAA